MGWWIVSALMIALLQNLPPSALAYEVADVSDGGSIVSRVVFVGTISTLPPLRLTKDQDVCAPDATDVRGQPRGQEHRDLAGGDPPGKAPPAYQPILDNREYLLTPRVQGVMVGTQILIKSSEGGDRGMSQRSRGSRQRCQARQDHARHRGTMQGERPVACGGR
jgi:hypothetical protein